MKSAVDLQGAAVTAVSGSFVLFWEAKVRVCGCLTWPVRDGALGGWDGTVCERASPACGPGVSFSSSCVCATGQTKDLENRRDSGTPKSSWLNLGAGSQLGAGRSP